MSPSAAAPQPPAPSAARPRGAFIVFEGLDRSGKSTQSSRLVSRLASRGVAVSEGVWRYPDRTTAVGGLLNGVIGGGAAPPPRALHLLFTANRWERDAALREALDAGVTVVADRYAYSGVAYSAGAEGVELDWCRGREEGLVAADLVVYLRVDPETAAGRGGFGEERYEKVAVQKKVGAVFDRLVEEEKGWEVVDAAGSVEEVEEEVLERVEAVIERVKTSKVRLLWN